MKVQLLYEDRAFPWEQEPDEQSEAMLQDLELEKLLTVMSGGEKRRQELCRQVMLLPLQQERAIRYRQEILQDCAAQPWIPAELRAMLERLQEKEKRIHLIGLIMELPPTLASYGRQKLQLQLEELRALRQLSERILSCCRAAGLLSFAQRICRELTPQFFEAAEQQLRACSFKAGIRARLALGEGLKPEQFVSLEPDGSTLAVLRRKLQNRTAQYTFAISDNDNSGAKALSELEQKSLNSVANVLMQTASHVARFFEELDRELVFYEGALRLREKFLSLDCPLCYPTVGPWQYQLLCDGALCLQKQAVPVGNSHNCRGAACVMITGANQGGKTTYLRSVGQAAVLAQAGLAVTARQLQCPIYGRVVTHFRREEDQTFRSGKLDEELERMDRIVDTLTPGCCLLMNESFAATNEEDGTELAWQIMQALLDNNTQIFCVTHFFELSRRFWETEQERTLFLRAVRREDGSRTYALQQGEPAATGHGKDLYERVFGGH